ncbi:TRAP-type C4-dicarboxylate transport system, small permease component [Geomicrobium sp. JCM 19039]|nr:TRAP-type C4-dicarboxylate transport system, small permease component [Geomicrobium sp. JCM 19039]
MIRNGTLQGGIPVNRVLDQLEEYIAIFSLFIATAVIFFGVVLRYFFGESLSWSGELARYLIIWFIFIGSSIAVRERAHAKVDIVISYVPATIKRALSIIASTFAIIFCLFIVVSGIQMIQNTMIYSNYTPALNLPMYIPYLALPVGSSLMVYRFVQLIIEDIKGENEEVSEQ